METQHDERRVRPEIVENYRDFEPPANFRMLLEDLLDGVPAKYLVGLKTIVLVNHSALTRNQRRQKTWSRNRKIRLAAARGCYLPSHKIFSRYSLALRRQHPAFRKTLVSMVASFALLRAGYRALSRNRTSYLCGP